MRWLRRYSSSRQGVFGLSWGGAISVGSVGKMHLKFFVEVFSRSGWIGHLVRDKL